MTNILPNTMGEWNALLYELHHQHFITQNEYEMIKKRVIKAGY